VYVYVCACVCLCLAGCGNSRGGEGGGRVDCDVVYPYNTYVHISSTNKEHSICETISALIPLSVHLISLFVHCYLFSLCTDTVTSTNTVTCSPSVKTLVPVQTLYRHYHPCRHCYLFSLFCIDTVT
jgi:hypothetical protein